MRVSDAGQKFLVREEGGMRLLPYRDQVGVWTVGIGHTGPDVLPGIRWPFCRAQAAFADDLVRHSAPLAGYPWLKQNQFDALASFIFNAGAAAFSKATFRSYLAPGEPLHPTFNDWHHGTRDGRKVDLPVLMGRRERERRLYEAGDYGKI